MKRIAVMLLLSVVRIAQAQEPKPVPQSSPVMDMIESAKNALNNLQYSRARLAAREVLALGKLKRSQEIAALQVAAAAYYPDDPRARMPDSANVYLRRLARLMPSGPFPSDLVSPALDSQLVMARHETFGATVRAPLEVTLKGTEARSVIEVSATRPARWQLYVTAGDGGPPLLVDTLGSSMSGRLAIRAHNGVAPVILPGVHQFKILGISATEPDTITLKYDWIAAGSAPILVEMPAPLDSSKFLPERSTRQLGVQIFGALFAGGAAWALGNAVRPPQPLADEPKDSRAAAVGVGIAIGAIASALLDHGKPLPANVKANQVAKANYLKQVGDATETNRKRIGEYTLAITIDPEIK